MKRGADLFFPALAASALLHTGIWGVSKLLPSAARYPVRPALSSIDVLLVEEPDFLPAETEDEAPVETPQTPEEVITAPEGERDPVDVEPEEVIEKPPPRPEPIEAAPEPPGAVVEAVPLEFVNAAPEYPALARRRGWEGTVVLRVRVDKNGHPADVEVSESSGYRMLDDAAQRAVRQWRFQPARSGAVSFASTVNIPVRFQLVDGR
jgi:protein TonB